MNFAVMPELSWKHGFIYSMCLTLGAAILPLWYIKRRGWLRLIAPERAYLASLWPSPLNKRKQRCKKSSTRTPART